MLIRRYEDGDEKRLFELLQSEDGWECYGGEAAKKYKAALLNSITYVALEGDTLYAYIRCREDDGFGVYVYDLLVSKPFLGKKTGKSLIDRVCKDFSGAPVYVMSDADGYYEKLGLKKEGSVFVIEP